ncbi:MAG: response regulator [Candidatus Omnitrophica bacterium]|nr:response regulator [Candidatus Omnitrophota bacterium]
MPDKKRIFIVDDEPEIVKLITDLLEPAGFEVKSTTEPKQVIYLIKSFKPNLILLDLLMPTLGGLEICEMLNKDSQTQGIPIIVISALAGTVDVKKAYSLGIVSYFKKPFELQKLLAEIKKILSYKETQL